MNLEEIAEDYLSRLRSKNAPSVDDYVKRFPELADEIRDTLPALAAMEQFGLDLADSDLQPPILKAPLVEQVGDYRILGELGRGGMGIVYEAEQQSLRRRVALKVFPRVANDEIGLARFQREARAAARLHHTNIVPVFQVGEDGDHAYYAMQLIEGQGLDAVIKDLRGLPRRSSLTAPTLSSTAFRAKDDDPDARSWENATNDSSGGLRGDTSVVLRGLTDPSSDGSSANFYRSVAQIGLQAAGALAYAHDRGVVHRDVKPSNLLLDATGVVWVSDFGLAMTDEGQLTRTQDVLGTLRYMSPERFEHQCDARADVYALGITLYELIALEPAFRMEDRLHLIQSILNVEPPAPRKYDARVPLDLETIILKAIEKEPRDRYQSAQAMADDLRRFLGDEPIEARRVRPLERLLRWRRRNHSLAAALSAVAALLLMLFGLLSWTSIRQRELLQLAESRGDTLLHNLYFSQMNVAGQAAAQEFGTDTIRSQLSEWDPVVVGKDFRNWEWYYLYGLSHDAEFVSERLGNGFCWACDHSPDGSLIVNTKNGWGVQLRDSKTGKLIAVNELGSARFVDWSPDGEKIAVGQFGDTCYILDAETLEIITEIVVPDSGETWCVRWHPNSRWLAEVSENKDTEKKHEVRIHDAVTGRQLYALKHPKMGPRFLSWHPDGTKLATSGGDKTGVWHFTEGQPQLESELKGYWATWSPDGSMLAVSRPGGIWDALSDRLLAESLGSIAWSSDSRRLAIGCDDGTVRIHDLQRDGAIAERFFRGHESEIWSVSWHPNGRALASCGLRDETLRIFNLGESDNVEFSSGQASVHLPELTSNGTQVVFSVFYSKAVFTYDLAGETSTRKLFPVPIGRVAPSPDGTTIAVSTERPSLILWNVKEDSLDETVTEHQFFDLAWNQHGELAGITTVGDIVVRGSDGTVLHELPGAHAVGSSVHWSPDGRRVASIGSGQTIKLWDVASEELLWQVSGLTNQGCAVRFSHDGTRIATSHREALMIWDAHSGEKLATLDQIRDNFVSLDWSPDGSRIVSGSNSSVAVWDVAAGRVTIRLDAPNRLFTVRWSDDGKRILAGGNTIILYDASRGYSLNGSSPVR